MRNAACGLGAVLAGPGLSTNFFHHPPGTVPKYNLSRPEINVDRPEFKILVFLHYH